MYYKRIFYFGMGFNILVYALRESCFNESVLVTNGQNWLDLAFQMYSKSLKVRGHFVQTLCIEKDSYMDAI